MNVQLVHTAVINNVTTHLALMNADVTRTMFSMLMEEAAQVSSSQIYLYSVLQTHDMSQVQYMTYLNNIPDVDECTIGTHNCSQQCHNIRGSHECSCDKNFALDIDGQTCLGCYNCS